MATAVVSSSSPYVRYLLQATVGSEPGLDQVLHLRLSHFSLLVCASPSPGLPYQVLQQSPATPMASAMFPLPLPQLRLSLLRQHYIARLLASLNLPATACERLARDISSFAIQITGGNAEVKFHIVADIDYIHMFWIDSNRGLYSVHLEDGNAAVDETLILGPWEEEEASPSTKGAPESAIERLRRERFECRGEDLGECSVCCDELNGGKAVIRLPCRHVYHESCILRWLKESNSCPLCRSHLHE